MTTLDLNSSLAKYLSPDGIITGTYPVLMIVPKVINAIPALNGRSSELSCEPPSGNIAILPPSAKASSTFLNTVD
jgi:hypothetical protein